MFYITTPIYYVNDTPHIGHAYTTVVADILTRYHRLFQEESVFLTGVDEHGQKVQNKAKELGRDPQEYVDEVQQAFRNIWKELDVQFDIFMRTTSDFHKRGVQAAMQELFDKGKIYPKTYEGWYCVSEEIFYTEKDIHDGKCPQGHSVQNISEKNYFFKMSEYQKPLVEYIERNPNFIRPESKRNEVLGFLKQPLEDLCISRPKSRLSWGIELPFDKDYVTYVWFDALLNYATGVGYKDAAKAEQFNRIWPHVIHLIGKDILITHSVYWTTMLMALNVPLPKMIFAHGWWLTEGNEKMSKSKGPVVKPLDMKDIVGVDGLRYFLARDIHLGNDAQFSKDLVISRVNSELANNLGNLLSRSTNLISKYFSDSVPERDLKHPESQRLAQQTQALPALVQKEIQAMAPNLAIGHVIDLLNEANRYLENQAPWKAAKTDTESAGESLYVSVEVLRVSATLLHPVMPKKMTDLLKRVGWNESPRFEDAKKWGLLKKHHKVEKGEPLFPRVENSIDSVN